MLMFQIGLYDKNHKIKININLIFHIFSDKQGLVFEWFIKKGYKIKYDRRDITQIYHIKRFLKFIHIKSILKYQNGLKIPIMN